MENAQEFIEAFTAYNAVEKKVKRLIRVCEAMLTTFNPIIQMIPVGEGLRNVPYVSFSPDWYDFTELEKAVSEKVESARLLASLLDKLSYEERELFILPDWLREYDFLGRAEAAAYL